ncbi:MAG TPA: RNA polymerase sigma-54 factor [Acidobacteriota bacterium]|jgi:RNA polymerase sigma-54 factor
MVVRRNSLKPSLSVQLSQRLAMTPSLLQKIELLTLSRLELSEMLNEELLENPALEEEAESSADKEGPDSFESDADGQSLAARGDGREEETPPPDEFQTTDETIREIEYYFGDQTSVGFESREYFDDDRPSFETFLVRPPSLYDHLEWQINLSEAPDKIRDISRYLSGNLNEDGYLLVSLEEAGEATGSSLAEVEEAQKLVMQLDPLGVGSRNLQECLIVQIQNLFGRDTLLEKLATSCLPLIQMHKYKEIAKELKCEPEEIEQALVTLRKLSPKPGQKYASEKPRYIQPDIYIYKTEGIFSCLEHPEFRSSTPGQCPVKVKPKDDSWTDSSPICGRDLVEYEIEMNEDGLPKLRLSAAYRDLLKMNNLPKESKNYIKEKWRSAQELLKSVSQRKHTIYRVCSSIVSRQRDFLDQGITHLKPMLIKDVADELGVHSSTISRAVTNKYVYTPQGVMELRSFFTVGVESSEGDNLSIVHVKHKIKQIIQDENGKKPLSDQKIANMLNSQGIQITRRTVAKYRDQMKVPGSRGRKGPL